MEGPEVTNASEPPIVKAMTSLSFPVLGMSCASCVGHVDHALRALPGVVEVEVDLVGNRALVTFAPGSQTAETLAKAVRDEGYDVPELPTTNSETAQATPDTENDDEALEARVLKRDLIIATGLSLPVLVLAMSHGALPALAGEEGNLVQFVLATFVLGFPGRRFFVSAWKRTLRATSDMNTLIAIGAGSAWLYSTVALLFPGLVGHHGAAPHLYFEAAALVLTFVLFGKYLEARTKKRLTDAVRLLLARKPKKATKVFVLPNAEGSDHGFGNELEVNADTLLVGDTVLVRPGEAFPSDGTVVDGSSTTDESMLTGESRPVEKALASEVFAGSTNLDGKLVFRVAKIGSETMLAHIAKAVREAQGRKAPIARLADEVSRVFVPTVLVLALGTFATWAWVDGSELGFSHALLRALAVLVIACPCALGLATPAAVAVATGRGADLGILVKGGASLEAASHINQVFLDKTGTLTEGRPGFSELVILNIDFDENELLTLIGSVENGSEHPVARALVEETKRRNLILEKVDDFQNSPGFGVFGRVRGMELRIGSVAWMTNSKLDSSPLEAERARLVNDGCTAFYVAVNEKVIGLIGVKDLVRPESARIIRELQAQGIAVTLLSGDQPETAVIVGKSLGITDIIGGVSPVEKAAHIEAARKNGSRVAMVGDGINDAPALAAADVGIALGHGTDVALASADIGLMSGGLAHLPLAFALASRTMKTIRRNLFWAFAYNVVGIPLAAGVFESSLGWSLSPVFASAAMSLSSVSVLLSSLSLRRFARAQS